MGILPMMKEKTVGFGKVYTYYYRKDSWICITFYIIAEGLLSHSMFRIRQDSRILKKQTNQSGKRNLDGLYLLHWGVMRQ